MTQPFSLDALLDGAGLNTESPLEKQASVIQKPVVTTTAATELEAHLTKQAQEETPNMTTPSQQGQQIALNVLQLIKRANDEGMVGGGGNNLINETSAMVGMSSAGQLQNNMGNPNQVLQNAIANALANGAVHPDQLDLNVMNQGADGGNTHIPLQDMAGNYDLNAVGANQVATDQIEKVAAVATLVDSGYDFDYAVAMVKQAEQEILAEEDMQIKQAAVNTLMSQGYDVNTAVALIKQASAWDSAKNFAKTGWGQVKDPVAAVHQAKFDNLLDSAKQLAHEDRIKGLMAGSPELAGSNPGVLARLAGEKPTPGTMGTPGLTREQAIRQLGEAPANASVARRLAPGAAVAGAGLLGVGGVGYGINRAMSKEAHVHACLAQGYSLEQALASLG